MLELLRKKQGKGQVSQQQDGENQRNYSDEVDVHGLPQLLAGLDVEKRQGEEDYREQQHPKILHRDLTVLRHGVVNPCTRIILAHALSEYQ
jgi:hypothetical protein